MHNNLRRGEALKNLFLFAGLAAVLGGTVASVNLAAQQSSYSPNDIKMLGTLDSGQTSKLIEYSNTPQYRAFVFEGNGHDQVEVTVTGGNGKAFVALADSTLSPIASGNGRLSATLPYHGPDTEAFYILVKSSANQPEQFAVHLKKTPGLKPTASAQPLDATH